MQWETVEEGANETVSWDNIDYVFDCKMCLDKIWWNYEEHANRKHREKKWCKRGNRWNNRYENNNNNHELTQQPTNVQLEVNQPPLMSSAKAVPISGPQSSATSSHENFPIPIMNPVVTPSLLGGLPMLYYCQGVNWSSCPVTQVYHWSLFPVASPGY